MGYNRTLCPWSKFKSYSGDVFVAGYSISHYFRSGAKTAAITAQYLMSKLVGRLVSLCCGLVMGYW
jgi:hypothetical protein